MNMHVQCLRVAAAAAQCISVVTLVLECVVGVPGSYENFVLDPRN